MYIYFFSALNIIISFTSKQNNHRFYFAKEYTFMCFYFIYSLICQVYIQNLAHFNKTFNLKSGFN